MLKIQFEYRPEFVFLLPTIVYANEFDGGYETRITKFETQTTFTKTRGIWFWWLTFGIHIKF